MFTTTVTYKDFNDNTKTEQLFFHMMAPEFADLQFSTAFDGDLGDYIRDAMSSGEGQKIYTFFKLMIVNAYGRRSEDGSEFVKRPEFTEKFLNSRAYEEFFMWLVMDPKNAEKFWNGIVPERLLETVNDLEQKGKKKISELSREELEKLFLEKMAANAVPPAAVES